MLSKGGELKIVYALFGSVDVSHKTPDRVLDARYAANLVAGLCQSIRLREMRAEFVKRPKESGVANNKPLAVHVRTRQAKLQDNTVRDAALGKYLGHAAEAREICAARFGKRRGCAANGLNGLFADVGSFLHPRDDPPSACSAFVCRSVSSGYCMRGFSLVRGTAGVLDAVGNRW